MTIMNRLNLGTKITIFMAVLIFSAAIIQQIFFIRHEASIIMEKAQKDIKLGLLILENHLAEQIPELKIKEPIQGFATALHWSGQDINISASAIDKLSRISRVHLTLFKQDKETGNFIRTMTSLQRPDGSRAIDTALDPDGPAHKALTNGERYDGYLTIFDTSYLTAYEPILDDDGKVVGALFAGAPTNSMMEMVWEGAIRSSLATIIMLGLTLIVLFLLVRNMVKPLVSLVGVVDQLTNKEFDIVMPKVKSQDEIGRLSIAIHVLCDRLAEGERLSQDSVKQQATRARQMQEQQRVVAELHEGLQRLSEGSLATPIPSPADNPFPKDYEALRLSYNATLVKVGDVLSHVRSIAETVRDKSREISRASRDLSNRAENQAATLEQSAAALNELTVSVASTAERAVEAEAASIDNRNGAEAGAFIAKDAILAMEKIESSSNQIKRILSVIDDIAFQTNLLALNAGVEAARAGEAGRGFAVVASEVRVLARRASESAKEIKSLIAESSCQVNGGSELVGRAGQSLTDIFDRAKDAAKIVAEIAVAATEQASGIAELNIGINQLDQVTQQNSAMAIETTSSAASLLQRSEDLIVALSEFSLLKAEASGPREETPSNLLLISPDNIRTIRATHSGSIKPSVHTGTMASAGIEPRVVDWAAAADAAAMARRQQANGAWHEF